MVAVPDEQGLWARDPCPRSLKVRVVFVSESVFVTAPLAAARHRLLEYLRLGDMDSLASDAYGEGVTVFAQAGVGGLAKTVEIDIVPAYERGPATVIPLRWTATGPLGSAFPVLDANVELTGSETGTDLMVIGTLPAALRAPGRGTGSARHARRGAGDDPPLRPSACGDRGWRPGGMTISPL